MLAERNLIPERREKSGTQTSKNRENWKSLNRGFLGGLRNGKGDGHHLKATYLKQQALCSMPEKRAIQKTRRCTMGEGKKPSVERKKGNSCAEKKGGGWPCMSLDATGDPRYGTLEGKGVQFGHQQSPGRGEEGGLH